MQFLGWIKASFIKFVGDTKLEGIANMAEDSSSIQEDHDKLEYWAETNKLKFNREKCKTLHLGKNHQRPMYRMGDTWLGTTTYEKYIGSCSGTQAEHESEVWYVAAKTTNAILDCISRPPASKSLDIVVPLTPHRSHLI